MTPYADRLRAADWTVRPTLIGVARKIIEHHHYARGSSNTATYLHGLFRRDDAFWDEDCCGVAWWIPPTKSAAIATCADGEDWQGVLALSRLSVMPDVPKNACSFLLARSRNLIDRNRWPVLVTYADEWQGHTGTIYRADNWQEEGTTKPEPTYVQNGRMISRKAGPKTRTRKEMEAIGCIMIGRFTKRKFTHRIKKS